LTRLLQDREDDACWWECRGRQPCARARGVLASSFLPAAGGGKKWSLRQPCIIPKNLLQSRLQWCMI